MPEGRLAIASRRYSSWSMRGWLAVQLAGLDVEVILLPVSGTGRTEAIEAVSPSGLVPYLEHRDVRIWESLAIIEYCAEIFPPLWPAEREARAHARAISAEMHAGFRALREAMPMNLGRADFAGRGQSQGALADIARIERIWRETRDAFGADGPYLFGATFGGADVMYAPVVTRLLTYAPPIAADTRAYCDAVRTHPLVEAWYKAVPREPAAWRVEAYENPT
ncbi:MAG: glutathione S-transferase [Acetobacteraceae bacterium]|nr:glutathione S-transferase [Acetobacteraceae bacterium]